MNKKEVYAAVTAKIIANLETAGSWMKMWKVSTPVSLNGHVYRGINRLVLSCDSYKSRVYGTFAQVRSNGGMVRKGEKSSLVVFWKKSIAIDEVTKESKMMFLLKYYHVFNSEQADFDEQGNAKIAQMNQDIADFQKASILSAEEIIQGYPNPPHIRYSNKEDRAYYSPTPDMISIPEMKFFQTADSFYKTLFHEMGHSTGHQKRLDRLEGFVVKGDETYSKEELVAEMCSAFLSGIADLDLDIRNSAAYIKGWSTVLRNNENWVMWAASRAEKAADHILGIVEGLGETEESKQERVKILAEFRAVLTADEVACYERP